MNESREPSHGKDPKQTSVANSTTGDMAGSTPGGVPGHRPDARNSHSVDAPRGPKARERRGSSGQCPTTQERRGGSDRRQRRRALISAPIRVRVISAEFDSDSNAPEEISTTLDVSRNGVLFVSSLSAFTAGMEVAVTFPYTKARPQVALAEQAGRVVRISELPGGRRSVAIALSNSGSRAQTLCATKPARNFAQDDNRASVDPPRPLVLVVDADRTIRDSLKVYLGTEGYQVFAVNCAAEAHEVLKLFTPVLLIAEIEGDDLPGFELCAHCKATPRLQTVPVVLLTRSAYPSDYANAHSLGAVVCMAKPYRQERLGHIVRLLAPTAEHKQVVAVRPIDPSRRCSAPRPKKSGSSMCDSVEHRPPWRVWGQW